MEKTMTAPCVTDEGIHSLIPDAFIRMTTFVEAYHRLGDDLEQLRTGFSLEHWQFHAAMAFYFANKALFDAEYARFKENQRKFWEEAAADKENYLTWSELRGALRDEESDNESDEEINKLLEEMS